MLSPWTVSDLDALDAVEIKRGLMACAANPNASVRAAASTAIAQFVEHLKLIIAIVLLLLLSNTPINMTTPLLSSDATAVTVRFEGDFGPPPRVRFIRIPMNPKQLPIRNTMTTIIIALYGMSTEEEGADSIKI